MTPARARAVRRTAVALFLLVGIVSSEVVLRLTGFTFRNVPTVQFGWPNTRTLNRLFVPDPYLFWVPPDYQERLQRARREQPAVLFLGDSCTYWGSYPQQAQERLRRQNPALATAAVLGVPGFTSEQGKRQFERDLTGLHPRVVSIFFGWNDHWLALGPADHEATPWDGRSGLGYWLTEHFRLAQLYHRVRLSLPIDRRQNFPRVGPERYEQNLRTMVSRVRSMGARPMFLTAPTNHRPGHLPEHLEGSWVFSVADLVPLHQRYLQITRRVARETNSYLCDTAARFAEDPRLDEYFILDGIHLTASGNARLAALVSECIVQANATVP